MTDLDLAELRRIAEAATPGPWEAGDRWHVAGVLPERFGEGRCVLCDRHGEPSWVGKRDINGQRMLAHVHTSDAPWHMHGISAVRDDGPLSVVIETDEYGTATDGDRAHIAAFDPPTVLALIDRIKTLEGERDALDKQVWRMRALRTDDSAEKTLTAAEARADRAEARLARVTDDSTSMALHRMLMRKRHITDGQAASFAVTDILATIRAVAADEQEAG